MNQIIMSWTAASLLLIAVGATTGITAESSATATAAPVFDTGAAAVSESVLWSFGATSDDGTNPTANLIADGQGNLYGTTPDGGVNLGGTVFKLSPPTSQQKQWSERVLWSFGAGDDGSMPVAGLIADQWGNLYGTTASGGANALRAGTVFELSPPHAKQTQWSESVLWSFGASGDGQSPVAGLIADKWGNLYGTTELGGENGIVGEGQAESGDGTVFELSPPTGHRTQWTERVLWSFGASGDGVQPLAGLLADKWGNLYGTTPIGGANVPGGTVFELSPPTGHQTQWSERVLWSFGFGDGFQPDAGLIADQRGNLYGTTLLGGSLDNGAVFELGPPTGHQTQWNERVLWSFGASGDGEFPQSGLLGDSRGKLYGTTTGGGALGGGTAFELSPPVEQQTQWSEGVLWSFGASGDGAGPYAGLIADRSGNNLYGTTEYGGANHQTLPPGYEGPGEGTVFELNLPSTVQSKR